MKNASKEKLSFLHTGDGMLLGFFEGPDLPLNLAIQLHKRLAEHNKSKIPSETIAVRIGIHSGNVYQVTDIFGNKNYWGPGIVIARRVMDFGDDGHILLSSRIAEDLLELSDEYRSVIKPIHNFTIKHGQILMIYSAVGKDFGNKSPITKGVEQKSKFMEHLHKLAKTAYYGEIIVHLKILDPATMLVRHKRTCELVNVSGEPITHVMHGIATDIEKDTLEDLQIKIYDENNSNLEITNVVLDKPYQKEFETNFTKPILQNDCGRKFTLEYQVEEPNRYYENAFLVECKKFSLTIEYVDPHIKPIIYHVNQETEQNTLAELQPCIEQKNGVFTASWNAEMLTKGQTIRLEW